MTRVSYPDWWLKLSERVGQRVDGLVKWWRKAPVNRYRFLFREGVTQTEIIKEDSSLSYIVTHNEKHYEVDLAEGWVKKIGRFERWFGKIKEERWFIFDWIEPTKANEKGRFDLLKVPDEAQVSANLLKAVHDFKGVDEGLSDEFRKPSRWDDLPAWVLIVAVIVLIIVGVYVAIDTGVIKL